MRVAFAVGALMTPATGRGKQVSMLPELVKFVRAVSRLTSALAMLAGGTVEPDWVGVVDDDGEDGRRHARCNLDWA